MTEGLTLAEAANRRLSEVNRMKGGVPGALEAALEDAFETGLIADATVAQSEVDRAQMWAARELMSEHKELKDLYVRAATQDNDEEVRGNALGGIDRFVSIQEAVQFLRQRLGAEMKEKIAWGAFNVVKFQMEHPEARAFMKELTNVPFSRIAERAREEATSG